MTNAIKNLLEDGTIVIFDCDGCLCIYEMGEKHHVAITNDKWSEYLVEHRPYDTAMPIPQVQRFIKDKGVDNVYVCSKAFISEEEQQKTDFILREYNIPPQNICFVRSADEKIDFLKKIAAERCGGDESKVALVEDTVSTIDAIYETSEFLTIHISSFFSYDPLEAPELEGLKKSLRQQAAQYRRRSNEAEQNPAYSGAMESLVYRGKAYSYEHALHMAEGSDY